jgi:hypothetical protein
VHRSLIQGLQPRPEPADKASVRPAALAHWILIGSAGLAGTLTFTAVRASRGGCAGSGMTDLIAIGGVAGFGLAVAALLVVGTIPRCRSAAPAVAAVSALALSIYAMVAFLAHDGGTCF